MQIAYPQEFWLWNSLSDSNMQPGLRTTGLEKQRPQLRALYTMQGFWTLSWRPLKDFKEWTDLICTCEKFTKTAMQSSGFHNEVDKMLGCWKEVLEFIFFILKMLDLGTVIGIFLGL